MSGVIVNYNNNALTSMSSSGTKTLLTSGKYCEGNFEVVYSEPTTSSLTVTPTETAQTFNATGVYGYKPVTINAISSTYVGTGIARKSSTDTTFTSTNGTFTAPIGYYSAAATKTLTTQAAQTIYPSTADRTISSYRWLTGAQTIKSVTTSNLTAENIAEGVTVKVGDTNNASRITQVTGTHSGGKTYTATISGSGHVTYCYVKYNNTQYYTNGDTFTFKEGDTITFYTRAGNLIIDDIKITSFSSYSYSYTAPDKDISIVLSYTNNNTNNIEVFPSKYVGYITSTINNYCKVRYNSTDYKDAFSSFSFKKGESVTVYAYDGVNAGTDIYLNGTLVANAVESGSTTYTFTPNESFDICWTQDAAYIATYKVYTCTIGTLSANNTTITYKNKDRGFSNTSFQFKAGELCTLEIYGTMGGCNIYEDGAKIGTCDMGQPYTYILPAHDILISTSGGGGAICKINSKRKVRITQEGIQWVSYVKYNNTYYYTLGEFEVFNGETIQLYCGNGNINNYIYVNGEQVNDPSNSSYTYTVSEDVDIQLSTQQGSTGTLYANEHIVPSDTLSITSNGTYNVYGYRAANVSTPISNDFLVTLSQNAYGSLTIDKTFSEIISACKAGKKIAAYGDGSPYYTGAIDVDDEEFNFVEVFGYSYSGNDYLVICEDDYTLESNFSAFVSTKYYYHPDNMNATPSDVLSGKRFVNNSGFQVGTATGGGGYTADDIAMRTISGDISGNATRVGNYAFYNCTSLTTVSFPNVTSIGIFAFYNCTSLTTVSFPNVTSIGGSAFFSCHSLTTVSFPNATRVGSYAFQYCSSLTTANFPSATNIGNNAFQYCSALTTVDFPNATSIGNSAFYSCYALTTVSFPSATIIGNNAFQYCRSSLTTVNFPNVTSIGSYAFSGCRVLTTASFPSVTSIGNNAFYGCYNLLSLYLLGSSVPTLGTSVFATTPIDGYTTSTGGVYGSIFVPSSLYDQYIIATNWSSFSSRIVSV